MRLMISFLIGLGVLASQPVHAADTINIFTYRQPALLASMLDAYTEKTGITFQTVYAPKGLVARLQSEGENARADMVLTVDISRVKELADSGLLAPLGSSVIAENVPAHLRAPDDSWTALSLRAAGQIIYQRTGPGGSLFAAMMGNKRCQQRTVIDMAAFARTHTALPFRCGHIFKSGDGVFANPFL